MTKTMPHDPKVQAGIQTALGIKKLKGRYKALEKSNSMLLTKNEALKLENKRLRKKVGA